MPSQWLKEWFPHLPSALDRAPMAGLMCAGALLLGVALAGARSSVPKENGTASAAEIVADSAVKPGSEDRDRAARMREGDDLVEQTGQFGMSGERIVFIPAKRQQRFIALENLPLERVAKAIDSNSAPLQWIVSGKVSEYRGSYYLLLTRAQRAAPL
jgi:hypothetical protein